MFNAHRVTAFYALAACILAACLLGPVAAAQADDPPPDFKTLNKQLHKAYETYKYEKALELAEKMHELKPDDVSTLYNLACLNCLLSKKDKAYGWLEKAIDAGFVDVDHLRADDDFKTMRAEDRFRALIKKLQDKAQPAEPEKESKAPSDDKAQKPEKKAQEDQPKKKADDKTAPDKKKIPDPGAEPDRATLLKVEALTNALLQFSATQEYEKALECALKAQKLLDNGLTNYNVACMYALNGNKEKAFESLDRAAGMGLRDIGQDLGKLMKRDADLNSLRDDPRFKKALKKARKTEKALAKKQAKARDKGDDTPKKAKDKKAKKDQPKKKCDKPQKTKQAKKQAKPAPADTPQKRAAGLRPDPNTAAKVQELTREAIRLSQAKDYDKALEAAIAARNLWGNGTTHYNVACMLACLDRTEEAFAELDKAVELGFNAPYKSMADKMREDTDLDSLRDDPRFESLLKRADKPKDEARQTQPQRRRRHKTTPKPHPVVVLSPEDQNKVTLLTTKLVKAARAHDIEKALEYGLEANKIANSGLTNYNVACMLALLDRRDEAFDYLFKAAEKGFDNYNQNILRQMRFDPDLKSLRKDPRFADAYRLARKNVRRPEDPTPVGKAVESRWKVTLPPNHKEGTPRPLLVVLHNYAGSMEDHARLWKEAAQKTGVILLTPQGTLQLDDDGEQFQWGTDIETVEEQIMEAIDAVMDDHAVDQDKIILAGFSQGGAITWDLGIRNPDTFCGMIPVGGFIEEVAPADYDKDAFAQMRVFIMIGGEEPPHIIDANKQAAEDLRRLGAKAAITVYEDIGHNYPKNATDEQIKAIEYILNR